MRGPRSFASPCGAVYPALCILAVCTRGAFAFFNLGLVSFRFFYVAPTPAPLRAGLARTATSTGAGNKLCCVHPPTVRACSNGVHKVCSQGSQVGDLKCCRLADGSTEHARACDPRVPQGCSLCVSRSRLSPCVRATALRGWTAVSWALTYCLSMLRSAHVHTQYDTALECEGYSRIYSSILLFNHWNHILELVYFGAGFI